MPLPPDPDLKPVAAAQAALDAGAFGEEAQAPAPAAPRRARPVIEPAEPDAWRTTVQLAYPLKVDGELLTQLTIRRLTAGDVAELLIEDDDETSLNLRCRALMCGVHPDVMEALEADDGTAVAEACRPFLPRGVAAFEGDLAELLGSAEPA